MYIVQRDGFITTCLPEDVAGRELVDITTVADSYSKFIERETGKLHNSEVYYKQFLQSVEQQAEDHRLKVESDAQLVAACNRILNGPEDDHES